MRKSYRIATVGLWHLGEIYSAGLAELGHQVIGISEDKQVVTNLSQGIPPLSEPLLERMLFRNIRGSRLAYTSDFRRIKKCNVLWITFDTPVNDDDNSDLSPIWHAIEKSIPYLQRGVLVVVSSQIPLGTSQKIRKYIARKRPGLTFDYVYTPENLRLGEAVRCFLKPGRIVAGDDSKIAFKKIEEIFSGLKTEILEMSPESAEVSKHALNAFMATSISFINDIADVCEASGADVLQVSRALRSDFRIGPRIPLGAGLGFSGGTLGRDLKVLMNLSAKNGLNLPVIENVFKKNLLRKELVPDRLIAGLKLLRGKTISIFGLTYKPGTSTLRRSRALEIAVDLSHRGAALRLHDPNVRENELPDINNSNFYTDPYEAVKGSDAVVFITSCPEFKNLNFKKLLANAKPHVLLFDTSNFLEDKVGEFESKDIKYVGVGRKQHDPKR